MISESEFLYFTEEPRNPTQIFTKNMTHKPLSSFAFVLYTTPGGAVKLHVTFQDETLWLTQKMMAELFDVNIPAISKHLENIYAESELERD